ncbi:MAG: hypothetical protein ACK5PP_17120 [Acidimicrobiales bacterium]
MWQRAGRRWSGSPRQWLVAGTTVVAIAAALAVVAMVVRRVGDDPVAGPASSAVPSEQDLLTGPVGRFAFVPEAGPEPGTAIEVSYYAPDGSLADRPILIVMPGRGRNAADYRDEWSGEARRHGAVLLVPELPADAYPLAAYNLGNLVDDGGEPNPASASTFAVVEELFDHAVDELSSDATGYYLYGHSAGAQFVHRFMLYQGDNRVVRAVSANAGWYTAPDPTVDFPYGTDDGPAVDLDRALSAPLTVLVGSDDTDPDDDGLRTTGGAERQGATRRERADYFYARAAAEAEARGVELGWGFGVVDGAEHSNQQMVAAAAEALFNPP